MTHTGPTGTATASPVVTGTATIAIVALTLLWLAIATAIAIAAARRLRAAQQVLDGARANSRLLEAMPARPMLVHPDLKVEVDSRLETAAEEIKSRDEFGYVVVNDRLERATGELVEIVRTALKSAGG